MLIKILLILLLILLIALLVLAFGLDIYVTHPKKTYWDKAMEIEKSKDFWGDYDQWEKEPMNITCRDGYVLHGDFIPVEGSKKYVMITHGYTYNRAGSVKYANIFHDLGYNVYIYDLRHHGENKPTYCSMSFHESRDVVDVAKYLRERFGDDIILGMHGESLGSASSITALGLYDGFDFLVADCGFADLNLLMSYLAGVLMHLPGWVSHLGSMACLLIHGFRLDRLRPVDAFLTDTTTPVFFIHGADDDFIPKEHCRILYDACRGPKEISFYPGAKHAQSFQSDRARYAREIKEFLEKYI